MPNFPCASPPVNCPPNGGNPFINFSSEAPDPFTFLSEAFGPPPSQALPPLGDTWTALTAYSTCQSTVDQNTAQVCADNIATPKVMATWTPPKQQPNPKPPQKTYTNNPQMASATCPDGNLFFFNVPAGMFSASSQGAADAEAEAYAKQQAEVHLLCLSDLPDIICGSTPVNLQITPSSVFLPPPGSNSWSTFAVGTGLPPGLSFNGPGTGSASLSGSATTPGEYNFGVEVTLPNGDTQNKEYVLTVAGLLNGTSLANAMRGAAYNATLLASGFTNPIFTLDSPLPHGLAMDIYGNITGTPASDAVTTTFMLTINDGETGFTCGASATINVVNFDWKQTTWTDVGAGGTNFNPKPPAGAVFNAFLTGAALPSDEAQGQIPNVPGTACALQLVVSNFADPGFGWGNGPGFQLYISSGNAGGPVNSLVNIQATNSGSPPAETIGRTNGTYNYNFTLPNDGMPFIYVQVVVVPFNGLVANITGTLTPHS